MQLILLDAMQAMAVDGPTGAGGALHPRIIELGAYAGHYVLPIEVLDDPVHEIAWAALRDLPLIERDPAEIWPAGGDA